VTVGDEVDDDVSGAEPAREVLSAQVPEAADIPPTAPASAPYTDEVTVARVLPPGAVPDGTTTDQLRPRRGPPCR
jgi:hypothetical protein